MAAGRGGRSRRYVELVDWEIGFDQRIRGTLQRNRGVSVTTTQVVRFDPSTSIATTRSGSLYRLGERRRGKDKRGVSDLITKAPGPRVGLLGLRPMRGAELNLYIQQVRRGAPA